MCKYAYKAALNQFEERNIANNQVTEHDNHDNQVTEDQTVAANTLDTFTFAYESSENQEHDNKVYPAITKHDNQVNPRSTQSYKRVEMVPEWMNKNKTDSAPVKEKPAITDDYKRKVWEQLHALQCSN